MWLPSFPITIYLKHYHVHIMISWNLCQRSTDYKCLDLLLGFVFYSIGICLFYANTKPYSGVFSSIFFWFVLQVSISLHTLHIYFYMLSFFSITALNVVIIVVLNSGLIILTSLLYLSLVHILTLSIQTVYFSLLYKFLLEARHHVLNKSNWGKSGFSVRVYGYQCTSYAVVALCLVIGFREKIPVTLFLSPLFLGFLIFIKGFNMQFFQLYSSYSGALSLFWKGVGRGKTFYSPIIRSHFF